MFPLEIIHAKIAEAKLRHLLIGGQAFNTYSNSRATLDVDFLIPSNEKDRWKEVLELEGFRVKQDGGTFVQFSPPYGLNWPLDLMLVNEQTFGKLEADSRDVECLGIKTRVPSPVHLIALKLHAVVNGPRERNEKDFPDIIALTQLANLDPRSEELRDTFKKYVATIFMSDSSDHSNSDAEPEQLREASPDYKLELPIAPDWFSERPRGSWEAGYEHSCAVLKDSFKNPKIWEQRDREMVSAEFIWKD